MIGGERVHSSDLAPKPHLPLSQLSFQGSVSLLISHPSSRAEPRRRVARSKTTPRFPRFGTRQEARLGGGYRPIYLCLADLAFGHGVCTTSCTLPQASRNRPFLEIETATRSSSMYPIITITTSLSISGSWLEFKFGFRSDVALSIHHRGFLSSD